MREMGNMGSTQDRLLAFLYQTTLGRLLLKPLVQPAVSKLGGYLLSCKASCLLIKPFIRANQIDMTAYEDAQYASFNDFFTRKIRPELRPVDPVSTHLISPCDGKLTACHITNDIRMTIKHTPYTLEQLLRDQDLAAEFAGGMALIFRLSVDDYHRYCYPSDGRKSDNIRIPGVFHSVNPICNDAFPIYKENTREYCTIDTDVFGRMVMMEVGALLVGEICNHHQKAFVQRGQEKGMFRYGGSTVVLLLKKGVVELDSHILSNSAQHLETPVKLGEKIGTRI